MTGSTVSACSRSVHRAKSAGAGGVTLTTTNGNPGLGYASFLLGLPNTATVAPITSVLWLDRAIAGEEVDLTGMSIDFTDELIRAAAREADLLANAPRA